MTTAAAARTTGDRRIVVRGLTRRFGDRLALEPLDLDLGPGGVIGLLGPNGSGKSTLLRMLTGLVRPDAGTASVDGVALRGDGTAVRKRCTYAPGEISLYGDLKAAEHLSWLSRGRDAESSRRALQIAAELGLPLHKKVHTYSHGMKRQLIFAAAMAPRVEVRILDEISEGLDPSKRSTVLEFLSEDAGRGTTILLSSHHLAEVDRVCDTFVFLNEGRLVATEQADGLRERAARFLRVRYAGLAQGELEAATRGFAAGRVRVEGERVVVELEHPDPRPALAELAALGGLPPPVTLRYGDLSLGELYRDLYGVEAC